MSYFQQCIKTYDNMVDKMALGNEERPEDKAPLAVIGCKALPVMINLRITLNGKFVSAGAYPQGTRKIVFVTEKFLSRSGRMPEPAPLCDNLNYFIGDRKDFFVQRMKEWNDSPFGDMQLTAILKYLEGGTMQDDLENAGLIKYDKKDGSIMNMKDNVYWEVEFEDGSTIPQFALYDKFLSYQQSISTARKDICSVTGELTEIAEHHAKGIFPQLSGTAFLTSTNGEAGLNNKGLLGTFRKENELLSMGVTAAQKIDNIMAYLAQNQGVMAGDRMIICWNPDGKEVPRCDLPLIGEPEENIPVPSDYRNELKDALYGYSQDLKENDLVATLIMTAPTKGRYSMVYYDESGAPEFLDRISRWDEKCCWPTRKGVLSPNLRSIVNFAFGVEKQSKTGTTILDVPDALYGAQMQRLIQCRLDGAKIPRDIVRALTVNAGRLLPYSRYNRERFVTTTCAVLRKYYYDYYKEEEEMLLDAERNDRSYQFGRLLAVLEKAERDTYDEDEKNKRETNAIRMQQTFIKRPAYAAKVLIPHIKTAYFPKLAKAYPGLPTYYDKLIGQIFAKISEAGEENYGKPLTDKYLLGYYLQKQDLYAKHEKSEEENTEAPVEE